MIESYSADHTFVKLTAASEWTEVPIPCEPSKSITESNNRCSP